VRRFVTVFAAAALGLGVFVSAGLPATATAATRHPLGAEPTWVKAANRRGDTASSDVVPFRVVLATRNIAGATAVANAVSNPKSAGYKHYLSAAEYRARFAPTAASVDVVKSWLRSQGLTAGYVPANHEYVSAVGTAAKVGAAFGVHFSKYATQGKVLRAPDTTPSVPADLGSAVAGVVGLDQSAELIHPNTVVDADPRTSPKAGPPVGFRNAPPCSIYWDQFKATDQPPLKGGYPAVLPYAPCGYTPPQLRSVYGIESSVESGNDGHGVKVGIVDAFAAPTIYRDAREYSAKNDPNHVLRLSQFTQVIPPGIYKAKANDPCDPRGWYGEETLDVEAVHAMAPGADIVYSGGASCNAPDMDAALNNLVDGSLVNMVSNSYGDLGEDISPGTKVEFDQIATQAAAQGIGLYFSSGDDGDETDNLAQPETDFSADSPLVTAVGGTSLGVNQDGNRAVEQAWSTTVVGQTPKGKWTGLPGDFLYASGGGTSRLYSEPYYQHGVVPDALAFAHSNHRGRVVPDVAMLADPNTGMLVGETQTFSDGRYYDQYRIGGTSLASPLFTGVMAVADQIAGFSHGDVNPLLYSLGGTAAFNDVKPGPLSAVVRRNFVNSENADDGYSVSARIIDSEVQTLRVAKGYDNLTGMGTPNGLTFLTLLK
jgi:subtilase family serine protease